MKNSCNDAKTKRKQRKTKKTNNKTKIK